MPRGARRRPRRTSSPRPRARPWSEALRGEGQPREGNRSSSASCSSTPSLEDGPAVAYYEIATTSRRWARISTTRSTSPAGRSPRRPRSSSSSRSPRSAGCTTSATSTTAAIECLPAFERASRRRRRPSIHLGMACLAAGRPRTPRPPSPRPRPRPAARGIEDRMMQRCGRTCGWSRRSDPEEGARAAGQGPLTALDARRVWYRAGQCAGPATSSRPSARSPATPTRSRTSCSPRAGMIKKVAAGIYTLPRSACAATGRPRGSCAARWTAQARSRSSPRFSAGELWEESGRWQRYGTRSPASHLKDRKAGEFCFGADRRGVSHRRWCARDVTSLPPAAVNLYQIRTKFRDEIRPRFGLMRGREFLMNDAYSFDVDAEGLSRSYGRTGRRVPPDLPALRARLHGRRGGHRRDRRLRVARVHGGGGHRRGRRRPLRRVRLRREPREGADGHAPRALDRRDRGAAREVPTPGKGGIDDVVTTWASRRRGSIKSLVYETEKGFVVALLRGDRDVNEVALKNALAVDHLALATEDKVERATGAPVGYVGPHELPGDSVRIVADESIRGRGQRGHGRGPAGLARRRVRPAPRREGRRVGRLRAGARRRSLPALRQAARDRAGDRGRAHLPARHEVLGGDEVRVHRREGREPPRRHGELRDRRRAHHGGRHRAAPRRRRHRLAARAGAVRDRGRLPESHGRGDAARGGRALRRPRAGGARRLLRRPRRAPGRQVQGRRPDRLPDPRERRRAGAERGQRRDRLAPGQERAADTEGGGGGRRPAAARRARG